uniref:Uncharacterized protein n=1 Tax=Lactuca sativa TaxID=4236 RepID=A0A9R1VZ30_LACSA|nr:hypothetical protein LSAT_V11C300119080 [Lactuca sativa]
MSVIEHIPETVTIPKTWFRFLTKTNLIELGETPPYYPGISLNPPHNSISFSHTLAFYLFSDYIGVLSKIRDCTKIALQDPHDRYHQYQEHPLLYTR